MRRDLSEEFEPFRTQGVFELGKTGGVAARPRHALNYAQSNRIDGLGEHNWQRAADLLESLRGRANPGHQHVGPERDQLLRIPAHSLEIAAAPAHIDPYVPADRPARLLQPLPEGRNAGLRFRLVRRREHEHADAPHALTLLRAHRNRPRRYAAEQRDELAADLFDHLVSKREQPIRHLKPELFGCPKVQHQLEFCGLHDRQVVGLLAF